MMRIFGFRSILLTLFMLASSAVSIGQIGVGVSITIAPPALPVYEQPLCPGDGYIWTPGYWAWDDDDGDYYWVPGTWVLAPEPGFLWTPGWWGWGDGFFVFHEGYWGPHVGFYGGVVYGFGYFGHGYEGGRWEGDHFYYNREVNNINITNIHNVYEERVNVRNDTRTSYNGGNGGINERPTPQEQAAERERHLPPVRDQVQHVQTARTNRELHASRNQGKPPIAATPRPGALKDRGVVPAKAAGAPYTPPANRQAGNRGGQPQGNAAARGTENRGTENRQPTGNAARGTEDNTSRPVVHPKDLPAYERPAAPNTGNPKTDQKYQQQQQKLQQKQEQERQKLQQKQDQEHQRLTQQKANDGRVQQTEQKHQQQTQQLQQRHEQQRQQMQQRQAPPASHGGGETPKKK